MFYLIILCKDNTYIRIRKTIFNLFLDFITKVLPFDAKRVLLYRKQNKT